MEVLSKDLIFEIGKNLDLRSLILFSFSCKSYYHELIIKNNRLIDIKSKEYINRLCEKEGRDKLCTKLIDENKVILFQKVINDQIITDKLYCQSIQQQITNGKIKEILYKYETIPLIKNLENELEKDIFRDLIISNITHLPSIIDDNDKLKKLEDNIREIYHPQNRLNYVIKFLKKCINRQNIEIYNWIFNTVQPNVIDFDENLTLYIIQSKNPIMINIYLNYIKDTIDDHTINEIFESIIKLNDLEILNLFFKYMQIEFKYKHLIFACQYGNLDLLKIVLNNGFDPACNENTPFIYACYYNHLNIVNYLLEDPRVDPTDRNNEAYTLSERNGNTKVIERLRQDERISRLIEL